MKKKFLIISSLILSSLVGCGNSIDDKKSENILKEIYTGSNYTFFPSEKEETQVESLTKSYEEYLESLSVDYSSVFGEYKIYNHISKEDKEKTNIDLFSVEYETITFYFIKYEDSMYEISPFSMSKENNNCITHIGISDIDNDGHIEIYSAVNAFKDRGDNYYCASFLKVYDSKLKTCVAATDYDNVNYFKENDEGVLCIYNADGTLPMEKDLNNGILDKKYYSLATNLFDTPTLNTSKYEFKSKTITKECNLYKVDITINDNTIYFPVLLKNVYVTPYFTIDVKMTYLGKPFSYTNPTTYLDGATVTFKNGKNKILYEQWLEFNAIEDFTIETGQVIERTYRYNESLNYRFEEGTYDMIINYQNEYNNINKSIIVYNFLKVSR